MGALIRSAMNLGVWYSQNGSRELQLQPMKSRRVLRPPRLRNFDFTHHLPEEYTHIHVGSAIYINHSMHNVNHEGYLGFRIHIRPFHAASI